MAKDAVKEAKKEEAKEDKKYTYREIIGNNHAMSIALGKVSDLYIPDIAEMNKLTPLIMKRKDVYEAFEANRKKIVDKIEDEFPGVDGKDESKEGKQKVIDKAQALQKEIVELLDQECVFDPEKVILDLDALQDALSHEAAKNPKEVKNICQACGALMNTIDPDRNLLKAGDLAWMSDFVIIKRIEKG